jgi:hypothetical protein
MFLSKICFYRLEAWNRKHLGPVHEHTYVHHTSHRCSSQVTQQFKSGLHGTHVSTIHICEPDPGKTKSVTHARILLVLVALADSCRWSHLSYRLASGKLKSVTGKCFMCVCHCADNWKNFTPDHSVPSMLTVTCAFITIQVGYQMALWLSKRSLSSI